jgi:uncharacterized membrane protein YhaH (DUF805 family)
VNFETAVKSGYRQYFRYAGRATRAEYWYFYLFSAMITLLSQFIGDIEAHLASNDISFFRAAMSGTALHGTLDRLVVPFLVVTGCDAIISIAALTAVIPLYAVQVRRLHDTGRSGWWVVWVNVLGFAAAGVVVLVTPRHFHGAAEMASVLPSVLLTVFLVQPGDPVTNRYDL